MRSSTTWVRTLSSVVVATLLVATTTAQSPRVPSARLVSASRLNLPGEIDSSNPAVWALDNGVARLFVISSWGGIPVRSIGASIDSLRASGPVAFASHPGHGVWMEAIIPDDNGVWYGYYH